MGDIDPGAGPFGETGGGEPPGGKLRQRRLEQVLDDERSQPSERRRGRVVDPGVGITGGDPRRVILAGLDGPNEIVPAANLRLEEGHDRLDTDPVGTLLGPDREAPGERFVAAGDGDMPHEQGRLLVDRTGDGAEHPRLLEREHRRDRDGEPTGAGEILAQSRRHVGPLHRLAVIVGRHEPASREEPGGIVEMVPAVPAVVAHPPLIDVGILTRLEAVDGVLVVFGDDRASCRAAAADVRLALQEPDALLVEEVLVAKGSNRTEVDDVAGEFVVEGEAGEDRDLLLGAAVDHHQLTRSRHLTGEPHAAGAHDAAVDEQRDRRADIAAAAVEGI